MADIVKIPGIKMMLGGQEYVIPPLALNALVQLQDRLGVFQGGTDITSIETIIDAAHAALRRNYPDITREQVGDLVDLGNMNQVFEALMDVSGMLRKQQESGELQPGRD